MSDKMAFYCRKFLNKPGFHSTAFIFAEVPLLDARKGKNWFDESCLTISDCDRQITISLDWGDEKSLNNTLKKIDTLCDTLNEMRRHIKEQGERARKLIRKENKKRKKK